MSQIQITQGTNIRECIFFDSPYDSPYEINASYSAQALPSDLGLWQQISKELQKIIPTSSTEMVTDEVNNTDDTANSKADRSRPGTSTGSSSPEVQRTKEARERTSLTRGLSRYGPWGYLMLGMLLCGGALLMCGMWGWYPDTTIFGICLLTYVRFAFGMQSAAVGREKQTPTATIRSACRPSRRTPTERCPRTTARPAWWSHPTTTKSIRRHRMRHCFHIRKSRQHPAPQRRPHRPHRPPQRRVRLVASR